MADCGSGLAATRARSVASAISRSTSEAIAASVVGGGVAGLLQPPRQLRDGIALGFPGALLGRLVELLVVRQRVRVRPDHLGVDERRSAPAAGVGDRAPHRRVARDVVAPVDLLDQQIGEAVQQPRDVATRRLLGDRHRDRVAVVLDQDDERQLLLRRRVQRLPELALAGGALAGRDVGDLAVVQLGGALRQAGEALVAHRRFGAADAVQALRAGRTRARDDVQAAAAPVRRHLPAARGGVVLRADALQQHLVGRDAQREAEGAVAIVGEGPVLAAPQLAAGGDQDRLVPGARDLEEDLALVLELNLLVVEAPRQEHQPVGGEQLVARQVGLGARLAGDAVGRRPSGWRGRGRNRPGRRGRQLGQLHAARSVGPRRHGPADQLYER